MSTEPAGPATAEATGQEVVPSPEDIPMRPAPNNPSATELAPDIIAPRPPRRPDVALSVFLRQLISLPELQSRYQGLGELLSCFSKDLISVNEVLERLNSKLPQAHPMPRMDPRPKEWDGVWYEIERLKTRVMALERQDPGEDAPRRRAPARGGPPPVRYASSRDELASGDPYPIRRDPYGSPSYGYPRGY